MFGLLDAFRKPNPVTSTLVFDEAYCHSAAPPEVRTYEIKKGTTEIVFVFERFEAFINTYLFNHPYLPDAVKRLVVEKRGRFCAQVVQSGPYVCTSPVDANGRISLRSETLQPLRNTRRLRTFSAGVISFGIFEPSGRFHVLWATVYKEAKTEE